MPNHITTKCTVTGSDAALEEFYARMFTEEEDEHGGKYLLFDFRQIIPMPASVAATDGVGGTVEILTILLEAPGCVEAWERFRGRRGVDHLGPWKGLFGFAKGEIAERLEKAVPGGIDRARKMALCFGETGHKSWYEWSTANWGTKWNSYSMTVERGNPLKIKFDTAWDFPTPVFEAMAKEFPTLSFHCFTFNEGWNFAGSGYFNPSEGQPVFAKCKATDDLYEAVYDRKPEHDKDAENVGEEPHKLSEG